VIVGWINKLLTEGPDDLLEELATLDRMNLIPKRTPITEEKDLRPITMSNILVRVLLDRIRREYDTLREHTGEVLISDYQFGFKKRIGAKTMATMVAMITELNPDLHVAALDVSKAYDKVDHNSVMALVMRQCWPKPRENILRMLYSKSQVTIHLAETSYKAGARDQAGGTRKPNSFCSINGHSGAGNPPPLPHPYGRYKHQLHDVCGRHSANFRMSD